MRTTSALRALRFLASVATVIGAFEACSGDDAPKAQGYPAPPTISFGPISTGTGTSQLACDGHLAVTLAITEWDLRPPGFCPTIQCGQVRVRIPDLDISVVAASSTVDLDLSAIKGTLSGGDYAFSAELIDDTGRVFVVTDGGSSSAEAKAELQPQTGDCPTTPGAGGAGGTSGDAGASNQAGAAGASAGEGGTTGEGGAAGAIGSEAGAAGVAGGIDP